MTVDYSKFGDWEADKANYLVKAARNLGMDLSGYGELAINPNSGNTYIWLEDYPFVLYMPISCELQDSDLWVLWDNPKNGTEEEKTLDEFGDINDIYLWVKSLESEEEED